MQSYIRFKRLKSESNQDPAGGKNCSVLMSLCQSGIVSHWRRHLISEMLAALVSWYHDKTLKCFIMVSAIIVLGLGPLFCCLFYCSLKGYDRIEPFMWVLTRAATWPFNWPLLQKLWHVDKKIFNKSLIKVRKAKVHSLKSLQKLTFLLQDVAARFSFGQYTLSKHRN